MKIIILGAGQVGSTLAESLSTEKNDIVVIDIDNFKLKELQSRLDIGCVHGHGSYPSVLAEAGAPDADMLIAVTNDDETNMIACQIAQSIFQIPTKLARIRAPEYMAEQESLFRNDVVPVDFCISPELAISTHIKRLIQYPAALQVIDFADGMIELVAIKPYFGGAVVGKTIGVFYELYADLKIRILAVFRNNRSIPISDATSIEIGDEVFFISAKNDVLKVMNAFRRVTQVNRNIIIAGGGNLGLRLAKNIEHEFRIKIIETSHARAEYISNKLSTTTVLLGDASDRDLLISENIEDTDVYCALTNDDEANIMSALLAKRLGAKHVMALIARTAYIELVEGGPIDIAISPQQITIGMILTHLRRGDVVNVHSLRRGAAETIELIVHGDGDTSNIVGRTLATTGLPKSVSVAALIRNNEIMLDFDDIIIAAGDHLILLVADKKYIPDIETFFQVRVGIFH